MQLSDVPVIIQAVHHPETKSTVMLRQTSGQETMLAYLVTRIKRDWPGEIVLAASDQPYDDILQTEAKRLGITCFRGDRQNLPRLLHDAAAAINCPCFIRVMGSHPFINIEAMQALTEEHLAREVEYSYNGHGYGVLWGTECEVIKTCCLERLPAMNLNRALMENFGLVMRQNPDQFTWYRMDFAVRRPYYKVVLETDLDLALIQDIIQNVPSPDQHSIIAYLDVRPALAQSNMASPAQEVGLEKLYLHPGKTARLLSPDHPVDDSYPISVELSLTNNCNLECEYCSDKGLRERQGLEETLGTETLFRLFDDLKSGGTCGVVIEGGGEPTAHPQFEEIIGYLAYIGLAVGLITNGTSPLAPETLSKLEWIRVSLDASTRQEYLELKKVDCFESVLENIYRYTRFCPTVGIGYVITNRNISELETLILMMRDYGVSYVQCRPVVDCPDLNLHDTDLSYLHPYQTRDFAVITGGMQENAGHGNDGLPCRAHSVTTIISADGSVYLCGRLNIYDWFQPIGNINRQAFQAVWHGAERHSQAKMVANGRFCQKNCPQCRISKFNRLIERMHSTATPHFI